MLADSRDLTTLNKREKKHIYNIGWAVNLWEVLCERKAFIFLH